MDVRKAKFDHEGEHFEVRAELESDQYSIRVFKDGKSVPCIAANLSKETRADGSIARADLVADAMQIVQHEFEGGKAIEIIIAFAEVEKARKVESRTPRTRRFASICQRIALSLARTAGL